MMQNDRLIYSTLRGVICLHNCNTPVVREVAVSMGMKFVKFTDQWDLCWSDSSMDVKRAKEMKKYQVSPEYMLNFFFWEEERLLLVKVFALRV